MLMNCKRKIHEKLVFENAPQNPEAIKGIRAYLLALLSYATMSKRCENADFDLHIDIEGVPMRNLSRWRVFPTKFQAFLIALKIREKRVSSTEK